MFIKYTQTSYLDEGFLAFVVCLKATTFKNPLMQKIPVFPLVTHVKNPNNVKYSSESLCAVRLHALY